MPYNLKIHIVPPNMPDLFAVSHYLQDLWMLEDEELISDIFKTSPATKKLAVCGAAVLGWTLEAHRWGKCPVNGSDGTKAISVCPMLTGYRWNSKYWHG